MTVLVTGAGGFVGAAVARALQARGSEVRVAVRSAGSTRPPGVSDWVAVGDVGAATDWRAALEGVSQVIHLVARTHMTRRSEQADVDAFRAINVHGTRRLAEAAAEAGVSRLVYVSTVKVNGERTAGRPFTEADEPAPEDAYGRTKWEAEQAIREVLGGSGPDYVIIRPPLVHGPGVRANLRFLSRAVLAGLPLPLGGIRNRRSLVGVRNLADLLCHCLDHPAAANETFLVSDGEDVSTPELVRRIAEVAGRRARLVRCPRPLLTAMAGMAGRGDAVEKLTESLQIDSRKVRERLDWQPVQTLTEGLREMIADLEGGGAPETGRRRAQR